MKLEHVLPAISPLAVKTLADTVTATGRMLRGKIINYRNETVKASFYYRPYNGQLETLYAGPWQKTERVKVNANGVFEARLPLQKGKKYEYRAVIEYARIAINGENKIAAWRF